MRIRLAILLALISGPAFVAGCQGRTLEAYPEQLAGIGVVVKADRGDHVVQTVVVGGPAQEAGVMEGGRILAIDGEPTQGKPLASVVDQLRGKDGTRVVLRVDGPGGLLTTTVTRRPLSRTAGRTYEAR